MAPHYFSEGRRVGGATGCRLHNGGHFAEVIRAENPRADDRQHLRIDVMTVVKPVDRSASYAKHLARADITLVSVYGPCQYALESVDCLLVAVMAMRDRRLAPVGTSNSKIATEPPDALPSSRNRITNCPIWISSRVPVTMNAPV